MNNSEFSSLNLSPALQENLTSLGYLQMTPIQAQSLPLVLEGKDLIAKAKTGSGKTAAFALGLLSRLNVNRVDVQALVLCPTRELADQVAQEIRRLAPARRFWVGLTGPRPEPPAPISRPAPRHGRWRPSPR